jgi:predicted lipoprotein with Yx(FWY)xxD motif
LFIDANVEVRVLDNGHCQTSAGNPKKGVKSMRTMLIAMGIFAATSLSAFAAEPAKMVDTKMGKVLATEEGMTLYTFDKDQEGKSNCDEKCLKNWPAFHASQGAKPEGEWTLVKDSAGKDMWAYKGKPLYTFVKDKKEGDTTGDNVGGVWHVVK